MTQKTLWEKDAQAAREMIDMETLRNFIIRYFHEKIGRFTLVEDIEFLGRCFSAIEAVKINYYDSTASFNFSTWTKEEQMQFAANKYEAAIKKILFLNVKCREALGNGFMKRKVNKSDMKDVIAAVDAFAFVLENYEFIA